MTQVPYPYTQLRSRRYLFISLGKKSIEKVVDFIPLGFDNYVNLGFGDLLPDGSIDDMANSNNGDIVKVLATVVDILRHFTARYPKAKRYIFGVAPGSECDYTAELSELTTLNSAKNSL